MEGFTITVADTAPAGRPVVELGYFTLAVPDTATAGRFYGALFGWATEAGNAGDEYAHVANTQLPLGFTPGAADEPPVLYFRVDDVHAYAARVDRAGRRGRQRGGRTTPAPTPCAATTRVASSSSGSRRPATSETAART